MPSEESAAASTRFHACPTDPDCPHCARAAEESAWSFLDAAYCISLDTRDDRMAQAAAEFHRVGLCRKVIFYRPMRHPTHRVTGIWESHRNVALEALERGQKTVLILEDDVAFGRRVDARTARAVGKALAKLPDDWNIFFLGHWPLWSYLRHWRVLRTASACAHAYIASERLLLWLRDHPYRRGSVPLARIAGKGIDAAYALLPATYAFFPMIAIQSGSRSDHLTFSPERPRTTLKHLVTRSKHREWMLSRLMRPNEFAVLALSPFILSALKLRSLVTGGRRRSEA